MRAGGGFWLVAVLMACAAPALADVQSDRIADQLRAQGFRDIEVSRTLLGRTRIVANGKPGHREIVLDPRTGEVLRDLFLESDNDAAQADDQGKGGPGSGSSGSGNSGSDSDDGDDGDDKDSDSGGGHGHGDGGGGHGGGGGDGGGHD